MFTRAQINFDAMTKGKFAKHIERGWREICVDFEDMTSRAVEKNRFKHAALRSRRFGRIGLPQFLDQFLDQFGKRPELVWIVLGSISRTKNCKIVRTRSVVQNWSRIVPNQIFPKKIIGPGTIFWTIGNWSAIHNFPITHQIVKKQDQF